MLRTSRTPAAQLQRLVAKAGGKGAVAIPSGAKAVAKYLALVLSGAEAFRHAHPEIFGALIDSTAHVNALKVTIAGATRLLLLP